MYLIALYKNIYLEYLYFKSKICIESAVVSEWNNLSQKSKIAQKYRDTIIEIKARYRYVMHFRRSIKQG